MNWKINLKAVIINKRNFCYLLMIALTILIFVLYWRAEVAGSSKPIAHQTDIMTEKFDVTIGKIREIKVRCKQKLENVDLRLVIENESKDIIFDKKYSKISITENFNSIDYYSFDDPLIVEKGDYYATFYVDGTVDDSIIGSIVEYIVEYSGYYKDTYVTLCGVIVFLIVFSIYLLGYSKLKPEVLVFLFWL